ncbi:unnamed protein product [Arabidopsis thaliana]|uniref:DUF7054 domain-containing protein n=3 Tax=Arabidopsis TaxID=3701 RepID=A0A654FP20_ARATH|nr:hypothetical protein ISN45_At04g014540 [Arabidopsis thaliana x Arabidopsis arenosa]VYS62628.1 unnamed protein product [Arabidopsis thaliana]
MDIIRVKKVEKSRLMMKKKIPNLTENRLLVSIKVVGSSGPIRFVVKEDETVTNVIDITLRCYARQGRLPIFSSHFTSSFLLYSPYSPNQPLNPCTRIGSTRSMNFIMCKNPEAENPEVSLDTTRKISGKWRAWMNNSLALMLPLLKQISHGQSATID